MSKSPKRVLEFIIPIVYKLFGSVPLAGAAGFLWRHSGKLYWLATLLIRVYGIMYSALSGIVYVIKAYGKRALYVITVCVILFMLANMVLQYGTRAF